MDGAKWTEIILICLMAVFFGVSSNGDFDKARTRGINNGAN